MARLSRTGRRGTDVNIGLSMKAILLASEVLHPHPIYHTLPLVRLLDIVPDDFNKPKHRKGGVCLRRVLCRCYLVGKKFAILP